MAKKIDRHKGSLGITLVELMIVLIIIGVLSSLAIIRFSSASKKAKIREAAVMLAYLWDIQYEYYVANGEFIHQKNFGFILFEVDFGFSWFDRSNESLRKELNYSSPSGKSKFWYISGFGGSGFTTHAYPKVSGDFINWDEEDVDNSLKGITLSVDNDRTIYVYGFGNVMKL
ncbi:type II secretion system protein [bacterium]|nr:type II secretion system protein [bacterium]